MREPGPPSPAGATPRVARPGDSAAIAAIYAPMCRDTWISFELDPPSPAEMERRIAATLLSYPWLVAETAGEVRGYAYATQHRERAAYRWAVDVSVYIREDARGQGLGRTLYSHLFDLLRRQGYTHACAGIALPNPASVGLHEALGFRPVGTYRRIGFKLGAWHDVGWWQLQLQEPASPPREPVPFAQLDRRG